MVGGMHHSTCVDSTPAGPCRSPRQAGRAYCRGQEGHRWHLRKVRKKVASSKQFIATRDRRDTPNAKKFLVEAVRYLGTIRWVPSLLNNLAPADAERRKPRWSPRSKRGFILRMGGPPLVVAMLSPEKCRDRAAECLQWAESAPSSRVRDILLGVARTWTRLAIEAEEWGQANRPIARLRSSAPRNAPREPTPPTALLPRGSRQDPH